MRVPPGRTRSAGLAFACQFSAMQRPPRAPGKLRGLLRLLTLLALPRASLGDFPVQLSCDPPEQLKNGFIKPHVDAYEKGLVIRYYCNTGFKLIGSHVRKCMADEDSAWWNASSPQCQINFMETNDTPVKSGQEVSCENPVVAHGTPISEFQHTYTLGTTVAFECVIGYFMVGSYLIRCNENHMWNPELPICRKIAPDLCGAPLIPTGSVYPLRNQYKAGTSVVVLCNPQQCFPDETIEMSTICQGYNFWDPPVQPCFLRTSPDTSKLRILNGIIIGKKKHYVPGDNVTVQCYAGYSLRGPSVIRYIGGQKWLPEIPSCTLSFFLILLILAIVFIVLLLPVKMLCNKCISR